MSRLNCEVYVDQEKIHLGRVIASDGMGDGKESPGNKVVPCNEESCALREVCGGKARLNGKHAEPFNKEAVIEEIREINVEQGDR